MGADGSEGNYNDASAVALGTTMARRLETAPIHIDSLPSPIQVSLMRQQDFLRRRMRYEFP
jgi:hypothetical protein